MDGWLTAERVEHIQWAVQRNRPVNSFVSDLQHSTLPALLEYGCLRATLGPASIPALPVAVTESLLGRALSAVPSPLGLHNSTRDGKKKPARVDARTGEFFSISTEDELDSDSPDSLPKPWQLFTIRFSRSAQAAGFSRTVADGLVGALYEMTRNALEHSESPHPALIGYHAEAGIAVFGVVDLGRGVLASLRSCLEYSHLKNHEQAISTAIQEGTSRHGPRQGGLGFREVFRALTEFNGHLRFRSGDRCLEMLGNNCGPSRGETHGLPVIPGFQVTVCCRTRAPSVGDPPAV